MIAEFVDSWSIFRESYLLGWTLSLLLPLVGVLVVLRRQVFIAVAISQASVLGISFFFFLTSVFHFHEHHHGGHFLQELLVLVFSLLASLLCLRLPGKNFEQREVATVLVFILSTAFSYLLLANTPLGLREVHARLSSSLISSNMTEVWVCLGMVIFLSCIIAKYQREIYFVCSEPDVAKMMGVHILSWEILLSVCIGASLGWCIHFAGWLFVFGTMMIPVYTALHVSKSMTQVFIVAPLIGLVLNVMGFVLSHTFDYPYSQFSIAFMGCILLLLKLCLKKRW